jgi:hypothetical protein
MTKSRALVLAFWTVTALFCLEMTFTAYYESWASQSAQAFTRLGFPAASFRTELSWAKILGVLAILIPAVPARFKEWAYAGFLINLVSALIAHFSIQDRHAAFIPSSITLLLWAASYILWKRLEHDRQP